MNLYYNGVDIYNQISLNTCAYESYGENQSDFLRIALNDGNDLWDSWKPQKGDSIRAVLGVLDTGNMLIIGVEPKNGKMLLYASSTPEDKNGKSNKSWQNIHFRQVCQEIAARHSLACEFYGVQDQLYTYINQENEEDFVFLSKRCILEGCAYLVYDRKLIVYNENSIENGAVNNNILIPNKVKFDYKDEAKNAFGKCIVKNGNFTGIYETGVSDKTLTKIVNVKISSQAEANRYAKNLLRYENKKMTSGKIESDTFLPGYAAGTMVNLQTSGVASWNCPVMVTYAMHDLVKARSMLKFRKTIEGY